jgi:hypothetical protein
MSKPMPAIAYHALLCGYLLAAGCGEVAYGEFVAEQAELECEIHSVCGVEAPASCDGPTGNEVLDDCHWFRPVQGQQCLDALVAEQDLVSDDPSSCGEWSVGNHLAACDFENVTRRRRSLACLLGKLGSGRPIREHGVAVVAPILRIAALPATRGARARAAARWCEAAQYEHASVASFTRAAAELAALGAPIELVRRCHDAARDEARHAEAALAIAASVGGTALRFGALPPIDQTTRALQAVALEALIDGCWGEAAAAVIARIGASRAEPTIADVLTTIACEETRHAELAWATVKWAVDRDPTLIETLLAAIDDHLAVRVARTRAAEVGDDGLGGWGLLGAGEIAAIELEVLARVVVPVLRTLDHSSRHTTE